MFRRLALVAALWPTLAWGEAHSCKAININPVAVRASLQGVFETAGRRFQIDPDLAQAITQVESGFDSGAVSPKGAQGLMQLMPGTSMAMHVSDPFNSRQSIYGGMEYLRVLADDKRFIGNPYMVLVAYNAGPNRMVFPEESYHYADTVLALYHKLKAEHLHYGGRLAPTRSLDHAYLSISQCERGTPSRVVLVKGMVEPSRHYLLNPGRPQVAKRQVSS